MIAGIALDTFWREVAAHLWQAARITSWSPGFWL
jgi:hypothetical protein